MNIPLLRRVQAHIDENPHTLNMKVFELYGPALKWGWMPVITRWNCIGGIAMHLENQKYPVYEVMGNAKWLAQADLLELSREQSMELFSHYHWPTDLYDDYVHGGQRRRADAAIEVIERFIAKYRGADGKVENPEPPKNWTYLSPATTPVHSVQVS
jgi:hypothetical protein